MKVSRRDLLIGGAGATAGLLCTPVPWKLLSDVSIWTQNWSWIPQPAHGPVETKQSVCTLCQSGCSLRVRMAAGFPVGVAGVSSNPITKGALCPLGFAAHQLNWHPQRLRQVLHRGQVSSWTEAQAAFEKACDQGQLVILDGRPGSAASSVFETFARKRHGGYRVVQSEETEALGPYAEWSGVSVGALGYDLENARTIVSFGAPLLDGWGTPGRFTRLWSERTAGAADPQLRLIQVEPELSRTAAGAWQWVKVSSGSDSALASGLSRVLLEDRLVTSQGPMPQMSLAEAAAQTGLSAEAIQTLARNMVEKRPVLAIAANGNRAVAALNVLLGAVGTTGGIVRKSGQITSQVSANSVITDAHAVLIDSTVPWEFMPQTNAEVFRFAAWDGGGNKANWLLPAPGFLEEFTDVPTAPTSAVATYAVAVNILPPPPEVKNAAQFLLQIDPTLPGAEKIIRTRCEEIFRARQGTVYGEHPVAVAKFDAAQKLEEQLRKGGMWIDDPSRTGGFRCELNEWPAADDASQCSDWTKAWAPPVFPPLAAKLYQESNLRELPHGRKA